MGSSSINSLLSSLESTSNPSVSQLLGQSASSSGTNASTSAAIQGAVNAILNSATQTAGSGINVQSTVAAIVQIDAAPEQALLQNVTNLNAQTTALQNIQTDLTALQTTVQALNDPAGAFSAVTVTSNDTNAVMATAANGSAVGSHGVMVNSLATTSAYYSTDFTSAVPFPTTGSLAIQVGTNPSQLVNIDSADGTNTLSGLVNYINQNNLGVTASTVTDTTGTRLSLVSQTSGSAGRLTVTDMTGTNGINGMGLTQATDSQGNALGTDASVTVDGVPITSGSNTVTGAIPGVTLTLSSRTSGAVTIGVQPDLTQVGTAINNFVTAYNKVMTDINTQNNASGTTPPPLLGDTSLDLLQSQLLDGITTSISGNSGLVNLQSIGIQMQVDGTLSVASSSSADSLDLNEALANNFSAVKNLFQSTSASSPGVAQALNTQLTSINNAVSGPLSLDMTGIANEVTDLNTQITNFQTQLQQTQTQLLAEYSTINTTLEQLPQTLASINSQLNALNPSKSG